MSRNEPHQVKSTERYTNATQGPQVDTEAFDERTPMGGETYRRVAGQQGEEPVYVLDEAETKPSGAEMRLERGKLTAANEGKAGAGKDVGGVDRSILVAGALLALVVVLGIVAIFFGGADRDIQKIEEQVQAEAAKRPQLPGEVQGIKVRKGIQQTPEAPPKQAIVPVEAPPEPALPLNTVPDGSLPSDAPPPPAPAPAPAP